MKTKTLSAMIIDQDPDQTRQISNVIKSLFNKVYTQGNLAEAIKEFGEIKPQVLFLNLTINQRTDNLELIEQLTFNQESPTVIFGYNDSQESELLAHAIETGVHDIFARPYDADIISSKINRYYQTEKTQGRESNLEAEKGKLVFMDFTAEWCLTCKVNKKLVLETDGFEELTKKYNLTLMRADWTKRDDNITQFLKKYKIVGVPAYFVQKPDGTIVPLGETITIGKIEGHLKN